MQDDTAFRTVEIELVWDPHDQCNIIVLARSGVAFSRWRRGFSLSGQI
jgi:hypothetical protein